MNVNPSLVHQWAWVGGDCIFGSEVTASLLGWAALGLQRIALWVEAFTWRAYLHAFFTNCIRTHAEP